MKTYIKLFLSTALALCCLASAPAGTPEEMRQHSRTSVLYSAPGNDKDVAAASVLAPQIRTAGGADRHVLREAKRYLQPRARNFVASASAPAVRGAVIFADGWSGDNKKYGIYELAPGVAAKSVIDGVKATDGGVVYENCFYAHEAEEDDILGYTTYVRSYDLETCQKGDYDEYSFNGNAIATDLAVYNYYDDLFEKDVTCIIGIFWADDNHDAYVLGKLEYKVTGPKVTQLAQLPDDWCAIAVNSKNEVYAIQRQVQGAEVISSTLWKIVNMTDLAERMVDVVEAQKIGTTGVQPYYMSSACFDPATDRLYWNVCPADGSGSLYEVDTQTGEATKLYDFAANEEVIGMYIPEATSGKEPAAPSDLTFAFEGGSLSGKVSFKAPDTQADGTPLSGRLDYELTAGGDAVASGNCGAGETVETDVITLPAGGKYSFALTVSNENGKSAPLKADFTAGFSTPYAPANVHMELDAENNVALSWDAVTGGSAGYFNAADIRYRVTAYPGARIVEDATAATAVSDRVEAADGYTVYYYTVEAIMGDAVSAPASSNSVSWGHITPPYFESFDSRAAFDGYTVIGQKAWFFYNNMAQSGKEGWLVTPPVALSAGESYKISFDAKAYWSWYPETLEVRYGTEPTEEGLSTVVMEAFEVGEESMRQFQAFITPEADGLYYIGFNHKVCELELDIDNIRIDAPLTGSVPAAPSDFTACGDPDGAMRVTVGMTAPLLTFDGDELTAVTKVEVYRGDVLVHTFETVSPGDRLEWTDSNPVAGVNAYSAYAFNASGRSEAAAATAFVGIDEPQAPSNIVVREISDGVVSVSWDAVTEGKHGNPMNPGLIKYDVGIYNGADLDLTVIGISETEAVFRAMPDGMQDFVQIAVFAATETGESYGMSRQIPVGTPSAGYAESFVRGIVHTPIAIERSGNSAVNVYTDADGVPSQDADGGLIGIAGTAVGAKASFLSGKISLAGTVEPALTFYSFTLADPASGNTSANGVEVAVAEAGKEYEVVFAKSVSEIGESAGWHKVVVPLGSFAGKTVTFRISATVVNFAYTLFDNFRVGSTVGHDLAISNISAPARVSAGEDYRVAVLYENRGLMEASGYVVQLYAGDRLVASSEGEPLAAGSSAAKRMEVTMHPLSEEPVRLYASIVYAADENPGNNTSETIGVEPLQRYYPPVTDLSGSVADGKVRLQWSEPDYGGYVAPASVAESFEDGNPFATGYGDWIFVDADRLPVGGFKNLPLPGIEPGSLQSFWVFDDSAFNRTFGALTGHRYLAAMYAVGGCSDEWAISPELSGEPQYISFYAKSYSSSVSEKLEVLCSDGPADISGFRSLLTVDRVPNEWTFYELWLPAGTRRFAVRYCADDAMMLMLDDFRFEAAGDAADRLSLRGFNVYRNGVRLNGEPVGDFSFTDDAPAAGDAVYVVTAVYDEGESRGSNAVTPGTSGISGAEAGRSIAIWTDGQSVIVDGAGGEPVVVATVDGCTVYSGIAGSHTAIAVPAGIYIVKAGAKTAKVIVK